MRPPIWALASLCSVFFWIGTADAEADHAEIARATLDNYIRPGYAELAATTDNLSAKIAALCNAPSAGALKEAKTSFAGAVSAWSKIEPVRFGPIAEAQRYERIFYWPDPKGIGLRQIRDELAKKDQGVTDPVTLPGKSVAVQGLPALEYLLFGDAADALAKGGGDASFRCAFATSIAMNIAAIAKDVQQGWSDDAPFTKAYLNPAADNQSYHTPKEVTLELFKTFTAGIETVRDQKLGKMLGATPEEAKPQLAPFWRSNLSFASIADNLAGMRTLFAKGGFAEVVHNESAGVENSILFDLDHAQDVIVAIKQPVADALRSGEVHAKLAALRVSLKGALQTAGDMIAKGAGLTFGFNAMDGD